MDWQHAISEIANGNSKALARVISLVENKAEGYQQAMQKLPFMQKKIIGVTGPPGAGKSTLVDALIQHFTAAEKKVGVICVDPSSPFNRGAILGDRLRMSNWYTHPNVFIRSLSSRGSLGGLNPSIIEICDVMSLFPFDYIIIETVGVGQSEVEIVRLADVTMVVLVPEGGDEIQTMKAGIMEIADVFVVNKADRPGADSFVKNLEQMLYPSFTKHNKPVDIIKTIATQDTGIAELADKINSLLISQNNKEKRIDLLVEKAYNLIQQKRMSDVNKESLYREIEKEMETKTFNLYQFANKY